MTEQGFYAFAQTRPNESVKWSTESVITPEPWMQDSACLTVDPDLFFPDRSDARTTRDGKKVCESCPVVAMCLEYALRNNEKHGTWGGLSQWELERHRQGLAQKPARPLREKCSRGHEFTPENVYTRPDGSRGRDCKTCRGQRIKEYKARKKEAGK